MADAGGFPDGRASKEAELGMAGDGWIPSHVGPPRGSPWWNVFQVVDAGVKEHFPPYSLQHVGAA